MQLGMVGLGKMGNFMTQRLLAGGHHVVAYDRDPKAVATAAEAGAIGADSLDDMCLKLTESPKVAWVMVPSGAPTQSGVLGDQRRFDRYRIPWVLLRERAWHGASRRRVGKDFPKRRLGVTSC